MDGCFKMIYNTLKLAALWLLGGVKLQNSPGGGGVMSRAVKPCRAHAGRMPTTQAQQGHGHSRASRAWPGRPGPIDPISFGYLQHQDYLICYPKLVHFC